MPKESEAFNKIDKNSAEMVVYSQNTEVEEVLISDDDLSECDPESYESKLNEKLRDLGLYEDDMTIQQKEELLSVIVASWETAEKEKTRREFFQDYMNASDAFCNDEIEFSFQELPELSNDSSIMPSVSSCLDVTLSVDTSHVSGYSGDYGTDSTKTLDDFDSLVEACGDESVYEKSNELESYSSREVKSRGRGSRRGRSRRGRSSARQSVGVTCVVNPSTNGKKYNEFGEFTNKLSEKEALEKSMSMWKPCLSPKDTPLISSKKPWLNATNVPGTCSEEEYSNKALSLIKEFDFVRKESQELWKLDLSLDKPYHLSRRVHFSKKSGKPDKYDIMVGVKEVKSNDLIDAAVTKSEPFSRTSGGAFHYAKSHRDKAYPTQNNYEAMTTRSGTRYGLNSSSASQKSELATLKLDSFKDSEDASFFKEESPLQCLNSPSDLFNEVEVILDEKLPHFNHLKPGLPDDAVSFVSDTFAKANGLDKHPENSRTSSSKPISHSISAAFQQLNHDKSSSYVGSDSSDTSSVIDVETIGDDEVHDFIAKRKLLQDFPSIDKQLCAKPRKRFRKGAS
ncbi:uncharacterized protein LOC129987867 isoform X1 [Argiope bruennichi]|uniref:uncharacterized protein LOC129987867 isoform X1 n=1 Tax=Argiope bruennichi TaxID=94029 RepID=UPI0024948C12|nr:uncharacterized protein LOC129987867 isoform X1 [Argiope bruennichi]XP_055951815.1 uncharacterized protein LOC129987867 isoform X1 [Argiope bruennichi]XP_055951816.1 uncharacterized protein LOC129987867 isoform X1 [Argiope bruennichi]